MFEDYFAMLAELSGTAHLMQMFDSTVIRAHVSAAGAKGDLSSSARCNGLCEAHSDIFAEL